MPAAIPLLAAGASIFAGVTAVTAAGATIGSMVAGGLMIAGGALTAIGAVTKNQKLMKIGGLVSLAGGIGGMMSGAWGSLVSEAATAPMAAASDAVADATLPSMLAPAAEAGAVVPGAAPVASEAAAGITGAADSAAAPMAAQELAATQAAQPAPAAQMTQDAFRAQELANTNSAFGGVRPVASVSTPGDWSSTLGKVTDWMERNKALTQMGGGIVQGAMRSYSEQAAVDAQLREQARRRAEYSAGIVGLQMPTYVAPAPYAPAKG